MEEELERRERTNGRIQFVLIGILALYIGIYYLFTIMDSIQMFQ